LLKVNSAADARFDEVPNAPGSAPASSTKITVVHEYGTAEIPLHIDSDRTSITVELPEKDSVPSSSGQK